MNGHKDIIILLPGENAEKGYYNHYAPGFVFGDKFVYAPHRNLFLMKVSHGTNQEHSTLV